MSRHPGTWPWWRWLVFENWPDEERELRLGFTSRVRAEAFAVALRVRLAASGLRPNVTVERNRQVSGVVRRVVGKPKWH